MANAGNIVKQSSPIQIYITKYKSLSPKNRFICLAAMVIAIVLFVTLISSATIDNSNRITRILTTSTLEKIINIDELSTFTSVYKGIAEKKNEKKPDNTDYFVSYEAKVNAGIDFSKVKLSIDEDERIVTIELPQVNITDVSVDIASLDFLFYNNAADTPTVSHEAFKLCQADVTLEVTEQTAILELAKQNAGNILKALLNPFIQQLDASYRIVVQ